MVRIPDDSMPNLDYCYLMKSLFSKLLLVAGLLTVAGIGLLLLLVDTRPVIGGDANPPFGDLALARRVIQLNNTAVPAADGITRIQITTEELEAAATWVLKEFPGTRISLATEGNTLKLAFTYGFELVGREFFLNSAATVVPDREAPEVRGLQLGSLNLEGDLGNTLASYLYGEARDRIPELVQLEDAVEFLKLEGNTLYIGLRRDEALEQIIYDRGSEYYLQPALRERMRIQAGWLEEELAGKRERALVPVAELLSAMMQRASRVGEDPVEDNRALILLLSAYVMGVDINKVLGLPDDARLDLRGVRLTAARRIDFAQHFLGSAGITLSAGNEMAQLLALAKEIDDTGSGGSGFSFTDLGADRAGSIFAELAVSGPREAAMVQQRLGQVPGESWFLPDLDGLPEYMTDQELQERFGGLQGPAYDAVMQDLEARLSRIPMTLELQAL
jgi:hypothetical protein